MYRKKAHIHFVGIGGIGMSGIATILAYQGYEISGCDTDLQQKTIVDLKALGATIVEGNNQLLCHQNTIDILVYSSAIKANNPEIIAAQKRGVATIGRALMLAELMRTKYSIAIAGSHGKTTTTSLISHILINAQLDPTVIIGGNLKNISTNARLGQGDFLVAEADESDRSLSHLHATLAIVTNIDLEHLETYKNLEDIKQTFKHFLNNIPFYGKAIICIDDLNVQSLLPLPHIQFIKYGIISPEADITAKDITLYPEKSIFSLWEHKSNTLVGSIELTMPGRHNILNALAAIALARELGISFTTIARSLNTFKGIERRFSYKGTTFAGAEIFDDYGHHPKEIECTLLTARKRSKKNLTVVFQPHRYTRTHKLWDMFIQTFLNSNIDSLIITDIYPASEAPITNITSKKFAQALLQHNPPFTVTYVPYEYDFCSIKKELIKNVQKDDLILLLGAGKINQLAQYLV